MQTVSYTTALMEIGVRDFANQMGPGAKLYPPAPPNSISYAGDSGAGAPQSADFSAEAKFGIEWLLKMWSHSSQAFAYQVDNTQEWNYYGAGNSCFGCRQLRGDLQLALLPDYRVRHLDAAPGGR